MIPNQCSACMDHSIDWQRLTTSQQYDSVEVEVWGVEPSICLQVHPRCWMKTASHCSCSINMSLVSSLCLQCGVLAVSCSIVAAMKTHWHFIEAHMACLMKTDSYRYTVLKRKLMLCFNLLRLCTLAAAICAGLQPGTLLVQLAIRIEQCHRKRAL